ncbi:MAG: hypothetical protein HYY06_00245 [Deltaproteobacteria bacterium]|nr:hypothetical protein [Deltaproteobacteria bacterium]
MTYARERWPNEGLVHATGEWVEETVDCGLVGSTSVAVGSREEVHVAYAFRELAVGAEWHHRYATNAAGTWRIEEVDRATSPDWQDAHSIAIALDADGRVHVAYIHPDGLRHAVSDLARPKMA